MHVIAYLDEIDVIAGYIRVMFSEWFSNIQHTFILGC